MERLTEFSIRKLRTISIITSKLLWVAGYVKGVSLEDESNCQRLLEESYAGTITITYPVTQIEEDLKLEDETLTSRTSIYKLLKLLQGLGAFVHEGGAFTPHHERKTPTTPFRCVNVLVLATIGLAAEKVLRGCDRFVKKDLRHLNAPNEITYDGTEEVRLKGLDNLPSHKSYNIIKFLKNLFGVHPGRPIADLDAPGLEAFKELLFGTEPGSEPQLEQPTQEQLLERHQAYVEAIATVAIEEGEFAILSDTEDLPEPPLEDLPDFPQTIRSISKQAWQTLRDKLCQNYWKRSKTHHDPQIRDSRILRDRATGRASLRV